MRFEEQHMKHQQKGRVTNFHKSKSTQIFVEQSQKKNRKIHKKDLGGLKKVFDVVDQVNERKDPILFEFEEKRGVFREVLRTQHEQEHSEQVEIVDIFRGRHKGKQKFDLLNIEVKLSLIHI